MAIFKTIFHHSYVRHRKASQWLMFLVAMLLADACAVHRDYISDKNSDTDLLTADQATKVIYFMGRTDEVKIRESEMGVILQEQINQTGKKSTLLLLGNNSIRNSFSLADSSDKASENRRLIQRRYQFFRSLPGDYFAIPGPHEWANGSRRGMDNARMLEELIDEELGQNVIRPELGCPGPEEIALGNDIVLLLIDTQWLFHNWDKPKKENGCGAETALDFYLNLDDAVRRNIDKTIILAGYHSLAANGPFGGYFPASAHLVPLPGLGSVNVGLRAWLGGVQDLHNGRYKSFINSMQKIIRQHPRLIYLSCHEKSLEFHEKDSVITANSGSYAGGVAVGQKNARFASGSKGYGRLLLFGDQSCALEFWSSDNGKEKLLYKTRVFAPATKPANFRQQMAEPNYTDSTTTAEASMMYTKKGRRPGILGNNYREEWVTPVSNIPYFDLGKTMGGFKIVQRGGGQQTKSLRLEGKDHKQYVLRSIEKYPANAVPGDFRNTVAVDIVTDQISAAHPYGAFAVPLLAEAAGIYHTNPKLFYLPDDERLGIYRPSFAKGLYLFEERPAKNREDVKSFGRSKDIVNTFEVLKELKKDGDHYVDQPFALRSRLFDMWIGDWDRHDDQWRWAKFKDDNKFTYYRPIPRDRDQAFFWSDGWLLQLASHNWGIAKFQGFHEKIRDIDGLNFNGRHFDRSFLTEPDRQAWINAVSDLQKRLPDSVIEKAIRQLPPEIFNIRGEDIIRKLKIRRDDLPQYAGKYYEFISKAVDITGSDKNERFIVKATGPHQLKVTVLLLNKSKDEIKRKTYERTFSDLVTHEIRLYGFGGDDIFDLQGTNDAKIKIRIIGGKGEDEINNQMSAAGLKHKVNLYDTKSGTTVSGHGKTGIFTSDKDKDINDYDRKAFKYNIVAPVVFPGYNPDDGIFLGAGAMFITHGFRKYPFKARHILKANIAPKSRSFGISYSGTFTEVVGKWNLVLNADVYSPSYTDYFYGYGNESIFDESKFETDPRYYSARYRQYIFYPELERISENEHHRFTIGGGYQSVNVKSKLNDLNGEQERFIISYANSLDYQLLDLRRHFAALYARYRYDNTNSVFYPTEGFRWHAFAIAMQDIDGREIPLGFQRFRSDISYYHSFGRYLRTTLALRMGGMYTHGDFEFYHAAKIGGSTNFRGVRKFRFAGENAFYQNTDLRIRLFNINNPVLPTSLGITLFHDFGRVWVANDPSTPNGESEKMHRAYGAGIWLAPLNKISFGVDYSFSTMDEQALYMRMGFFF